MKCVNFLGPSRLLGLFALGQIGIKVAVYLAQGAFPFLIQVTPHIDRADVAARCVAILDAVDPEN